MRIFKKLLLPLVLLLSVSLTSCTFIDLLLPPEEIILILNNGVDDVYNETIEINNEKTVRDVLDTTFDEKLIIEEDPKYGSFLIGIEGYLVATDGINFLYLELDGKDPGVGVNDASIAGVETIKLSLKLIEKF